MTNTIRLKITCFLLLFTVLLIKDILDLAWHLATRMKFGTCEQNWDLYGTISRLWPQLGPSPKFGTSLRALFLLFGFFLFRDQIFRNRDRDFFPRPNFFETETETFFPKPNFPKPKPRLFSETNFFRNRNRDFFSETKFSETEILKDLTKVSKPRSFETEMSISGDKYCLVDTDKRNDGRLEKPTIKLLSSVSAKKHFGTVINRNRNR